MPQAHSQAERPRLRGLSAVARMDWCLSGYVSLGYTYRRGPMRQIGGTMQVSATNRGAAELAPAQLEATHMAELAQLE